MDNLISSTSADSAKLGLKVAAVFVAGLIAVVVLLFAWELFFAGSSPAVNGGAPVDSASIDPKLEGELRKAVDFQGFQAPAVANDPFVDRAGLADAASTAGVTQPGVGTPGQPGAAGASGAQPGDSKQTDPTEEIRQRYEAWREASLRGGIVGKLESLLPISDLTPMGFVSGGNRTEKIIFFSSALCQTFSFPLGTKFFDGSLEGVSGRNVVFKRIGAKQGTETVAISTMRPVCNPKKDDSKKASQ